MSRSFIQIAEEALTLPQSEQLKLARTLLENAEASGDVGAESAWEEEIERRIHKIDAGLAKGRPFADVLRDIDQRLGLVRARDTEGTPVELDVLDTRFHQMRRDPLALGDDLVHRLHHRGPAHCHGPTAIGAHPERHLGRVAMHDIDLGCRHAELVGL